MVIMAANDCNAMATILVLTCPLFGSEPNSLTILFLLRNCMNQLKIQMMNHKIARVSKTAIEGFRGTKPLPRRGQIKSRIAANAFHSIISVLSKASSHHHSTLQESRDTTRK
uniref:Uncharacterized protein n=1 Tax=Solanum lycopersicum TaxID=4081 RepID=K4CPE1_SOLLC